MTNNYGQNSIKRASGVLMHVSSLWGDYSGGSFGKEARLFIDFLSASGFSYWQVLPFCYPDECNSPYKSFGAFSGNPYFIDLETLFEKGLITKNELESAVQNTPYLCEFDRLKVERVELLKKASLRFKDLDKLSQFFAKNDELDKFCLFMALKEANGGASHVDWSTKNYDKTTYFAWQFIEYEFFNQWYELRSYAKQKGVKIIGDMPIYVDYDSSDLYFNPTEFQLDKSNRPTMVAGVPPDYFCADGQLWGNPLYNWAEMKKNGYKWWLKRIDFYSRNFDAVRIDHFRGLESYFAIKSNEKTARNGKWKKGPGLSFVKTLKNHSNGMQIIAEDLGEITDEVRKLVKNSSLPGMRVLQFGFLGGSNSTHLPHNYENLTVAYTGTHDNNTLLGYVWELDENSRNRLLDYFGIPKEKWNECYDEIIRAMLASTAGLVIFPIQDLLKYGSDTRINTPGVAKNNWAFRLTPNALDKIDKQKLRYLNELYGRI